MTRNLIFTIIIFVLLTACKNSERDNSNDQKFSDKITQNDTNSFQSDTSSIINSNIQTVDTFLLGDINSDKRKDTAFLINPKFKNKIDPLDGGCVDNDCSVTINFSCELASIHFNNAIGGGVYNIGDINKDGVCELMFIPAWFQGCWGQMHFYSLKNKIWLDFGQAAGYLCTDEDYKKRIKKINETTIEVVEDIVDNGGDRVQKPKRIILR